MQHSHTTPNTVDMIVHRALDSAAAAACATDTHDWLMVMQRLQRLVNDTERRSIVDARMRQTAERHTVIDS